MIKTQPWSDEEVRALSEWQHDDYVHPYTCVCEELLVATRDGLVCPKCGFTQEWCYDFSLGDTARYEAKKGITTLIRAKRKKR